MKSRLGDVRPLFESVVDRAAGRRFEELPDDEFSVLAEPGTVGALLREIGADKHVTAALHHRRPDLFPLTVRTIRWQLLPHVREGDSGVAAVIHRELVANADAFETLRDALRGHGIELTALRLHDILLWLSGSLRLTHAVALGRDDVPRR
jgi:hypothetical protein